MLVVIECPNCKALIEFLGNAHKKKCQGCGLVTDRNREWYLPELKV